MKSHLTSRVFLVGSRNAKELLAGPLMLNFWRAPTDNDGFKFLPNQEGKALFNWKKMGIDNISWTHKYVRQMIRLTSLSKAR